MYTVPTRVKLGPILFSVFINDLGDGTECTLNEFADDTKLGGEVDGPEGCTAFQRDLNWLEKWATKNFMKFKKEKCKVLPLGRNNTRNQHRLGANRLESSLGEKDLVDTRWNIRQVCALAADR